MRKAESDGQGTGHLYTTAQLARILGVAPSRVRSWVRRGLIEPAEVHHRLSLFDFAQVASARALQRLLGTGLSLQRIRKGLDQLRGTAGLRDLESRGGPLLVRLGDGALAEPDGQRHLDFDKPRDTAPKPLRTPGQHHWFEAGVRAEEDGRLLAAVDAYRRALETGGPRSEVCFNLGNTLYALGRKREAARRFDQATAIDPDYVEAWNNLGNALADRDPGRAIAAYRRALELEPAYADAHYNLAESLALAGDLPGAREHWRIYLRLAPHDPWADRVRQRIEE